MTWENNSAILELVMNFLAIWHLLNRQMFNIMGNYTSSSRFHGTPRNLPPCRAQFYSPWSEAEPLQWLQAKTCWSCVSYVTQSRLTSCHCLRGPGGHIHTVNKSKSKRQHKMRPDQIKPETITNCESCPNLSTGPDPIKFRAENQRLQVGLALDWNRQEPQALFLNHAFSHCACPPSPCSALTGLVEL